MRSPLLLMLLSLCGLAEAAPLVWYDDAPRAGLVDGSWTTHNLANTTPTQSGPRSISMEPDFWGGVQLYNTAEKHRFDAYQALTLWVHGGSSGGGVL